MKFLKHKLTSLTLVSVLVISIFMLFFTASISYKQIQTLTESEKLVVHSYKVYIELEQLNLYTKEAESSQRGFLLTQDSSLLRPYTTSLNKINGSFDTLNSLLSDNEEQKKNLDSLIFLIKQRFLYLSNVLSMNDFRNYDTLKSLIENGTILMKQAQNKIDSMVHNELQMLSKREAEHESDLKISPFSILFIVLFSLLVFILSFLKINKDLIGLGKINNQLLNKDKLLEEKLTDLKRSNEQLSAFNHIASHDLQEPTRKVQIFISRIREKDLGSVPEKVIEYLSGIEREAARMQKFIEDLLIYSRANKPDGTFEPTDLSEILGNSIRDLSQRIEEKNVRINAPTDLPIINAIPFQIQQLFINLISNSIKYSKTEVAPVIDIKIKIVPGKDIPAPQSDKDKSFYKISFTDNGIGFEQQYAENIFTLFYRLHSNKDYSGTGIGLAICKIITENHKGYILAEGIPNSGSTFSVFLPV